MLFDSPIIIVRCDRCNTILLFSSSYHGVRVDYLVTTKLKPNYQSSYYSLVTSRHLLIHSNVGAGSTALIRWVGFIQPLTIRESYSLKSNCVVGIRPLKPHLEVFTVFLLRMIHLLTKLISSFDIVSFFSYLSDIPIVQSYLRIALSCRTIVQVLPVILFGFPPVLNLLISLPLYITCSDKVFKALPHNHI